MDVELEDFYQTVFAIGKAASVGETECQVIYKARKKDELVTAFSLIRFIEDKLAIELRLLNNGGYPMAVYSWNKVQCPELMRKTANALTRQMKSTFVFRGSEYRESELQEDACTYFKYVIEKMRQKHGRFRLPNPFTYQVDENGQIYKKAYLSSLEKACEECGVEFKYVEERNVYRILLGGELDEII